MYVGLWTAIVLNCKANGHDGLTLKCNGGHWWHCDTILEDSNAKWHGGHAECYGLYYNVTTFSMHFICRCRRQFVCTCKKQFSRFLSCLGGLQNLITLYNSKRGELVESEPSVAIFKKSTKGSFFSFLCTCIQWSMTFFKNMG